MTQPQHNGKLYIETVGCQMNMLDSELVVAALRQSGYELSDDPKAADTVLFNTCSVREHAEHKIYSSLGRLKFAKRNHPNKVIGVMGCMVGVRDPLHMRQRLPFVDVFMPPSEPGPMLNFLADGDLEAEALAQEASARAERDAIQDGDLLLPIQEQGRLISAQVPHVLRQTRLQMNLSAG
jgi:tRNA-2-methylthio-N6-dimethylallyladenosine synthase